MQSKVDSGDLVDPPVDPRRSAIMRNVRGKDTSPEMIVRSALHRAGYRYRLHVKALPGRPDIVFAGRKVAVFVHGCFWHRHAGCRAASSPSTRTEFWNAKFERNVERDARNMSALSDAGWRTYVVWECETKGSKPTFWPRLEAFLQGSPPLGREGDGRAVG